MRNTPIYIIITLLFISLNIKAFDKEYIIPNDTVYFDYSASRNQIFFRGIVNDTIETKIFFDTGLPTDEFIASDSLKQHLEDENLVELWYSNNHYKQSLTPRFYPDSSYIYQKHGLNTIAVGWEYFLGKVIQFSYRGEYLIIRDDIADIPDIETYDKIDFKVGEIYPYILIPINIDIQGNKIERNAILDTGANCTIAIKDPILEKYNLDYSDTSIGVAHSGGEGRKAENIQLKANSVSIQNSTLENITISYSPTLGSFDSPILVGNWFLHEYSVILDLENFVLYLKADR